MKTLLPPSARIKPVKSGLSLILALILAGALLVSCVEETEKPGAPAALENIGTGDVARVKQWFGQHSDEFKAVGENAQLRTASQELILPYFDKEPDWDKFHHYYFPDGREVFEISLENSQLYLPASSGEQIPVAAGVIQNIMFVKDSIENRFDPLIVRYFPDGEPDGRDFEEMNYMGIDEKWSGWIDLFTYDELHLVGYRIEQGEKVSIRQFSLENPKEGSNARYGCSSIQVSWFQTVTAGSYTSTRWLNSTYMRSCSWTPRSIEEHERFTSDRYTNYGGGNGYTYKPPTAPDPKLRVEVDPSVRQNPRVNCIVGKLALSEYVRGIASFAKVKSGTVRNTVIKLAPLAGGIYGHTQNRGSYFEITINSNKLDRPDLMIARTILHELVHAEIYAQLALIAKGGDQIPEDMEGFAERFNKYVSVYYGTNILKNDAQHKYMAENLLGIMGRALMDIHQKQFPGDYAKLNNLGKAYGYYPNGIPVELYKNLFWEGLEKTHAYAQMESIKTKFPIVSPTEKVLRAEDLSKQLGKSCGN